MYYLDHKRTITRRESSLVDSTLNINDEMCVDTFYDPHAYFAGSTRDAAVTATLVETVRPWGTVRKEVVSSLFESMLSEIVETWQVIETVQNPDFNPKTVETEKQPHSTAAGSSKTPINKKKTKDEPNAADNNVNSKIIAPVKSSRVTRNRSKISQSEIQTKTDGSIVAGTATSTEEKYDPLYRCWFPSPNEKVVIHFKNGNMYEGMVSMKVMSGEGRFQWADGTIFMGRFENNKMSHGFIYWKDDTWYNGDFLQNVRHGRGLFSSSRQGVYYTGEWDRGTKHGHGKIIYAPNNSYEGSWKRNERHGQGNREYDKWSGYMGNWVHNKRDGKGVMIWDNHDIYRGDWKSGIMDGLGKYYWGVYCNHTMSLPAVNLYSGSWRKGERHGYGTLELGLGLGSYYIGNFSHNKKHGPGRFISNNGYLIEDLEFLFRNDVLGPVHVPSKEDIHPSAIAIVQPTEFNICDSTVGLTYHIHKAIRNLNHSEEIRTMIVNDFFINNGRFVKSISMPFKVGIEPERTYHLMMFEESSLRKAISYFEANLKYIYYFYAELHNTEPVTFTPILIRMYLWQFYYDIELHMKGLTLVEIDQLFVQNKKWLAKSAHDPFERIFFWQFVHCLVAIATKLYSTRRLPESQFSTMVASCFRTFVEHDILPRACRRIGNFPNGFGTFVPLRSLYDLYVSIGEPHTVRTFLQAVQSPDMEPGGDYLIDTPDEFVFVGQNFYLTENKMCYVIEKNYTDSNTPRNYKSEDAPIGLPLFNFGNLSIKNIINIISHIVPGVMIGPTVVNLEVKITFYEFFEAFIECTKRSIELHEKYMKKLEKMVSISTASTVHSKSNKSKESFDQKNKKTANLKK